MYSFSSFGNKEQSAKARGGNELTGLYIKENSTGQMGYVISDHLGSTWALASDQGGFIEQYAGVYPDIFIGNPWGKRMDPNILGMQPVASEAKRIVSSIHLTD